MSNSTHSDQYDWNRFTGRSTSAIDIAAVQSSLRGKRILITGAGGYIASALAEALPQFGPAELVLLDLAELGLHHLGQQLGLIAPDLPVQLIVGSVLDPVLLHEIFGRHRPQIIFQAAACKHVPLMEANPFTAVATNALGSNLIAQTSSSFGAEQCILLSTDKAVDPISIMGASKRIAELVFLAHTGATRTKSLRLGNVLGSSGSVVPLFLSQIARGGPVTITHPDTTRYFLPLAEAVQHLLSTAASSAGSTILLPDIGAPRRIADLAKFLIDHKEPKLGPIDIIHTGLRPGDKLEESLTSARESRVPATSDGLHVVHSPHPSSAELAQSIPQLEHAVRTRDLDLLLQAVHTLVPEYRPSDLLLHQLTATPWMHSA